MDIEIKKLSPVLAKDYLNFFDVTPPDDFECKCYCVCWCSADHRIKTDFSSDEKRRELAEKYINDGVIQGYLAYFEGHVVAWRNANTKSDCLYCISWLRLPCNEEVLRHSWWNAFAKTQQIRGSILLKYIRKKNLLA